MISRFLMTWLQSTWWACRRAASILKMRTLPKNSSTEWRRHDAQTLKSQNAQASKHLKILIHLYIHLYILCTQFKYTPIIFICIQTFYIQRCRMYTYKTMYIEWEGKKNWRIRLVAHYHLAFCVRPPWNLMQNPTIWSSRHWQRPRECRAFCFKDLEI